MLHPVTTLPFPGKAIFLFFLTLAFYGCRKEKVDQEIQTNTWRSEYSSHWDAYTTVASNNKIAYYVGNSIYTHTSEGFTKIAEYPQQNIVDKFAVVAENGDLITGGGYRQGEAYASWSFYRYDKHGNLKATESIPDVYFGAPYPGKIHTVADQLLTTVNERQLGTNGTVYQKYIYACDLAFKVLFKVKIDNSVDLARTFKVDEKIYLLFSDGKVNELKNNQLQDAPGVDLQLDHPADNGIPAMTSLDSRLVYGWAPRVSDGQYVPENKMMATDLKTTVTITDGPAVCEPQLYYLDNVLYLVGGYTGKVDQKVYNQTLYSIRLTAQQP